MYHNLCKLIIVNKKISYSLVILISFTAQEESDYTNMSTLIISFVKYTKLWFKNKII